MVAVVEDVLAPVRLPAGVVRLVSEVTNAHVALELAQVAPRLVILRNERETKSSTNEQSVKHGLRARYLEPNVAERLVDRVALALLHLEHVRDQIDGWANVRETLEPVHSRFEI